MTEFQALPASQCLAAEQLPGSQAPDLSVLTQNVSLPSRATLLAEDKLAIGPCEGDRIKADALRDACLATLANRLGGLFALDLRPYTQVHRALVSDRTRAAYEAPGIVVEPYAARQGYVHIACSWQGWQIQAIGEAGDFQAVFLGRRCSREEALDAQGHTHPARWQELAALLDRACPKLDWRALQDRSQAFPTQRFIQYREGDGIRIKAGIRQIPGSANAPADYFTGLRITWP
jgi:hypothetical protein